jgi:uncharacterized protein YgbK (DUF1537 family)
MSLTIVADDLTGACDTGSLFAGDAPVSLAVWPAAPPEARVRVIDTESRMASGADAVTRVTAAQALAPASRYFKKIDSTLRGHVGLETDALMRAAGLGTALVCPAFPAQGRVVVERALLVDGTPVNETPVGRDAAFPALGSSSVIDVLRVDVDRPLAWISLDQVRAGVHSLAARIGRLAGTVIVADAETDADLDALATGAFACDTSLLLAGAAGLARAVAARLGLLTGEIAWRPGGRWLVVAGSRHPATRAQLAAARAAGLRVVTTPDEPSADPRAVARQLAAEARDLLARESFEGVAVTGGETAIALWKALGADGIELIGAPRPGIALGRLRIPRRPSLPLVTKAGGFGEPDLFVSLLVPDLARSGSA